MQKILYIFLTLKVVKNLKTFLLDYFRLLKDNQIIYTKNHLKFYFRAGSSDIGEVIIICSDCEYPKKFYPKKNNSVIVDIGANIGAFSIYISSVLKKYHPKIYAIEPSKENFIQLKKNLLLNKIKNVKPLELAISDKNKQYYLDREGGFDTFNISEKKKKSLDQIVEGQTLKKFCQSNRISKIDLLKIDIEGGEYALLNSSMHILKKKVAVIMIEVHDLNKKYNRVNFLKKISKSNFTVAKVILDRTYILINKNL